MNLFDIDSFLERVGSHVQSVGTFTVTHPAETVHLHAIPAAEFVALAVNFGLHAIKRTNGHIEFIRRPASP